MRGSVFGTSGTMRVTRQWTGMPLSVWPCQTRAGTETPATLSSTILVVLSSVIFIRLLLSRETPDQLGDRHRDRDPDRDGEHKRREGRARPEPPRRRPLAPEPRIAVRHRHRPI